MPRRSHDILTDLQRRDRHSVDERAEVVEAAMCWSGSLPTRWTVTSVSIGCGALSPRFVPNSSTPT